MLKEKTISEDTERDGLEQIQKLTDTYIARIDELSKSKEHEIMSGLIRERQELRGLEISPLEGHQSFAKL
jgi:hypothetical protein